MLPLAWLPGANLGTLLPVALAAVACANVGEWYRSDHVMSAVSVCHRDLWENVIGASGEDLLGALDGSPACHHCQGIPAGGAHNPRRACGLQARSGSTSTGWRSSPPGVSRTRLRSRSRSALHAVLSDMANLLALTRPQCETSPLFPGIARGSCHREH